MVALPVAPLGKVELDPFDVVTEAAYQKLRAGVTKLLEAIPDTVRESDIEKAMTDRRYKVPIDTAPLLEIAERDIVPVARSIYRRAGQDALTHDQVQTKAHTIMQLADDAGINLSFALDNPRAERWASRFAGSMVVEITRAQQRTLRSLILRALKEGGPPRAIARELRTFIGLHSRYATAVLNYRLGLESRGMLATRVDQLVQAKYAKLLKARSETIARTEVLSAANAGRQEAWDQAYRAGLFGTDVPIKEWHAAPDAEKICAALNGQQVELHDFFTSELGEFQMPPAHPNCRCTAVIVAGQRRTQGRPPTPNAPAPTSTVAPTPVAPPIPTPTTVAPVEAQVPLTVPSFQSVDEAVQWLGDNFAPVSGRLPGNAGLRGMQQLADQLAERAKIVKLNRISIGPRDLPSSARMAMRQSYADDSAQMMLNDQAPYASYWEKTVHEESIYEVVNGSPFSFGGQVATTPMERFAATIDHELGHGVYYQLTDAQRADFLPLWHEERIKHGLRSRSVYAVKNEREGFAECFLAYIRGQRTWLSSGMLEWMDANIGVLL